MRSLLARLAPMLLLAGASGCGTARLLKERVYRVFLYSPALARAEVPRLQENESSTHPIFDGRGGFGGGVVLTADGYILTAGHVVRGETKISVRLFDQEKNYKDVTARIVAFYDKADLALIKVEHRFFHTVIVDDGFSLMRGDSVYNVGFPYTLERALNRVRVIKENPAFVIPSVGSGVGNNVTILDRPIGLGASGSGVYSEKTGKLVGIFSAILPTPTGPLGLMVPHWFVRDFLRRLRVPYATSKPEEREWSDILLK